MIARNGKTYTFVGHTKYQDIAENLYFSNTKKQEFKASLHVSNLKL